jgi:lactose/L-arabinose transport system permease protein
MRSRSTARLWRQVALHALLTPLALLWLFPLWMMVVFSTLPENGIFSPEIRLLPGPEFRTNFQAHKPNGVPADVVRVRGRGAGPRGVGDAHLHGPMGSGAIPVPGPSVVVHALIIGTLTLPTSSWWIRPAFIMSARDMGLSNTRFALIVPPLSTAGRPSTCAKPSHDARRPLRRGQVEG